MRIDEDMTQLQRLHYMLETLLEEVETKLAYPIPDSYSEKRTLLRALVNVRPPFPISGEFLQVQDAFLRQETRDKGIITLEQIPPLPHNPKLSLWQGDITRLEVDAVVNAANSQMLGCFQPCHDCIDNAIHTAAGVQLRAACHQLMVEQGKPEPTGSAKITKGYNLPARYVLHTVGPIVEGKVEKRHIAALISCYKSCLALANQYQLKSIAFCCISTGVFRFPNELAARVATNTIMSFQEPYPQRVIFNTFTDFDQSIYQAILSGSE